jgi:hypothetical protein
MNPLEILARSSASSRVLVLVMKALAFLFILSIHCSALACKILDSSGQPARPRADFFSRTLNSETACPTDVRELKSQFSVKDGAFSPAMVGNRGFHNGAAGSFSFFEKVTTANPDDDAFFGHFTKLEHGKIALDQEPALGQLMVELIAWDAAKGLYNFYELIGTSSQTSRWYYRGDSADILEDNKWLHIKPPAGEKKFGSRLRCSACHISGGPIMKELAPPHNDWWTKARPLPLGAMTKETELWVTQLVDAGDFANEVRAGILKLEASPAYQKLKSAQSLQVQLRPLFCEQEINLESDGGFRSEVQIPSAFFMNPLLGQISFAVPRLTYENWLAMYALRFPETSRRDADHAWLTPVKGYSDLIAIQSLITKGVVTAEDAKKILEVDKTNPVFSKTRCGLLKTWPKLMELPDKLLEESVFTKLLKIRKAVFGSEISQNPRGQILEPGFRVIFPEASSSTDY